MIGIEQLIEEVQQMMRKVFTANGIDQTREACRRQRSALSGDACYSPSEYRTHDNPSH
jgi:hypothetical protein